MAMFPKSYNKKNISHPTLCHGTGVLINGGLIHFGQLHELHGQTLTGSNGIPLRHHGGGGCSAGG